MFPTPHEQDDLPVPTPMRDAITRLPDGAISVETDGERLVLRASRAVQRRFEELLERRKTDSLGVDGQREYEGLCQLDQFLSSLNRVIRKLSSHDLSHQELRALLANSVRGSDWMSSEMDIYDRYDEHHDGPPVSE